MCVQRGWRRRWRCHWPSPPPPTPMKRSPARLVLALSVAAVLAVFIIYTSIAGAGTPQIQPSQLAAHHGDVMLVGTVVPGMSGDAHQGGLRFTLKDDGPANAARPRVL